jgi:hypothetical protein
MKFDKNLIDTEAVNEFLQRWGIDDGVTPSEIAEFCEKHFSQCEEWPWDDFEDFAFTSPRWGDGVFTIGFIVTPSETVPLADERKIILVPQAYGHLCLNEDETIYSEVVDDREIKTETQEDNNGEAKD